MLVCLSIEQLVPTSRSIPDHIVGGNTKILKVESTKSRAKDVYGDIFYFKPYSRSTTRSALGDIEGADRS